MSVVRTGTVQVILSGTNISQAITAPSDAEMIVVGVSHYDIVGSDDIASASYDGNALTIQRQDSSDSDDGYTGLAWYADVSTFPTGSNTFILTWDSDRFEGAIVFIAFYKGVNGADPVGADGGEQTGATSANTGALIHNANDMFVGVAYSYDADESGDDLSWTNATDISQTAFNEVGGSYAEAALGSGSTTFTANNIAIFTTVSGMIIQAAPGSSSSSSSSSSISS
jgi:hypothetical protein